ncbi:hypothetical protein ACQ4PT_039450 [Festuca glaucescens]
MNGDGGQGGFNPGHGGFNTGRGGYGNGRGGYGNTRGVTIRVVPVAAMATVQAVVSKVTFGNNGFGGGRNFVHGESSGTAGMGTGHHEENWGGTNTNFQRSANFNNNNRFGYGGNQQRWNTGRGGGFQNRPRANGTGAAARNSIDADLLQQTVQAVVAAVTTATKITEPPAVKVPQVVVVADDMVAATGQQVGMSVAAPNAISQQPTVTSQGAQDIQGAGAKGKDNEGQGPLKKKEEDKAGCFHCKKPGHYIDDCPTPFYDLCESIHHAAPACHLLNAPKPTTTIHGYENEALMFFELPCGAFKAKAENPKLAKVTVDGDAMTIPEIIEQLKKIVPSEKFNWEVFHFRDNVFRVKLPSKQEVQRLKNFGLPSDIRSDYLSLWGVGTLFGKTLDVDMAYTRNNKVLRTKIGCLDRNLIPADSDVFIRRGFFKLRFEVETTQGYQEVNMVEANNGNDGNDDAHHGEENNGGGNAMDMDPKGLDEGNTSNNNGQEGSYENNGVDGMQVQSNHIDVTQIGTMNVQITPTDGMLSKSTSGLPLVGGMTGRWVASRMVQHAPAAAAPPLADNQLHAGQSVPRPMIGAQRAEKLVCCHLQAGDQTPGTMCERTMAGPKAGSAVATKMGSRALGVSPTPQKIRHGSAAGPASAMQDSSNHKTMIANDKHMIGADSPGFLGSSVHKLDRGEGMVSDASNFNDVFDDIVPCMSNITSNFVSHGSDTYDAGTILQSNLVGSLEQSEDGARGKSILAKKEEEARVGLQGMMGNASSTKTNEHCHS